MEIYFLGTAGGTPSPDRSLPCTVLRMGGRTLLLDCGEGSQRQLMISPVSLMSVDVILLSHLHGDHIFGIPGMLQTMNLFSRSHPLSIMGPRGTIYVMGLLMETVGNDLGYSVNVEELCHGDEREVLGLRLEAVETEHNVPSLGYVLREPPRPGKFHPERAKELGIPAGPLYSRLQKGEAIEIEGRVIKPGDVMGPLRRGRSLSYSGDTLPSDSFAHASRGVDLMIHEATFGDDMAEHAAISFHSTARQAAEVAKKADAATLIMIHISQRVVSDLDLEDEARAVLGNVPAVVARDFDSFRLLAKD
ncbi:MAG: Ribonuclease Z [Thermoplasmatales archaeon 49_6]|nr:MAG: Ribonuclease Z [Thermoplasmatales archaeon 49_6]